MNILSYATIKILNKNSRIIFIDIAILTCIYFIPALAHITPFPLYLLDPMRIAMLAGYFLTKQNTNAYLMALTIPLFSCMVSGHPPLLKAGIIGAELMINVLFLIQLIKHTRLDIPTVLLTSIICSKITYYLLAFVAKYFGFLKDDLITINIMIQIVIVIALISLSSIILSYKKRRCIKMAKKF